MKKRLNTDELCYLGEIMGVSISTIKRTLVESGCGFGVFSEVYTPTEKGTKIIAFIKLVLDAGEGRDTVLSLEDYWMISDIVGVEIVAYNQAMVDKGIDFTRFSEYYAPTEQGKKIIAFAEAVMEEMG